MTDRLEDVLQNQIARMKSTVEMMASGRLRTHLNGEDTTEQSISDNMVWIAELEEALARHRLRNA